MKKLTAILIILIFSFESAGYCLRVPMGTAYKRSVIVIKNRFMPKDARAAIQKFITRYEQYLQITFDLYARYQEESLGNVRYINVLGQSTSKNIIIEEGKDVVVGSKGYDSCIAVAMTWVKGGKKHIFLMHHLPMWGEVYVRISSMINSLRQEGAEDIKLLIHTEAETMLDKYSTLENKPTPMHRKEIAEDLGLPDKSVFLVTKEYSNTDVIVTPEGVAIFYITPDNRDSIARQFVFWEDPRVFEQHAPVLDNSVV
ncbi:MAG: hypothetical protein Q8N76_07240, partial [Candidatus Omnitrophota bacterium]|nr:hypothetical protein [Candidatus Omnitrophota bacterium]